MVRVQQIRVGPNWMDSIVQFLKEDVLPEDKSEADKVRRKAPRFWLFGDQDRKSTRLNSSHNQRSRMPSSA